MKVTRLRRLLIALCAGTAALSTVVLLAGCGGGGGVVAQVVAALNRGVYDPGSKPFGRSYGEWSAQWWTWALEAPLADNPLLDDTGAKHHLGQEGPVWFIAGATTAGEHVRAIAVPAGKAILFSALNAVFWTPEDGTQAEIQAATKNFIDQATVVEASVDGVALKSVDQYRTQSPLFPFTIPADGLGAPDLTGDHTGHSDGYWFMLEPLTAGQHTVVARGKVVIPGVGGAEDQVFDLQMTYNLTVG